MRKLNKRGDAITGFLIVFFFSSVLFLNAYKEGTLKKPNWSGPEPTEDVIMIGNNGNFPEGNTN